MENAVLLNLVDTGTGFNFSSSIESELTKSHFELDELNETTDSFNIIQPDCDRLDYGLAVSSGALCGIIDIFLVGKPEKSPLGDITDKWFENRTKDFAKLSGWNDGKNGSTTSAIRFLETKFKIPYDQRGAGDAGQFIFGLNPTNHHFKSLAHNPTLLGLFFSILDQFTNQSHFVTENELIVLQRADDGFELRGADVISKLFSAFVNWFGHIISDISGSSTSKGRGMGIPSPLWSWTNDIIAIKRKLNIKPSEFDKFVNDLSLKIFNQGYDIRFQATQTIPVMINELVTRLFYSVRRLVKYFADTEKKQRNFEELWKQCEPFSNPTVKRMLTVAHGTFCLIDIGDATVRGFIAGSGSFNMLEFVLRVNIVGVGRFTISLYGEVKRKICNGKNEKLLFDSTRAKELVEYYIEGLKMLSVAYDDKQLMLLIHDFSNSYTYRETFNASIELANKRHVPREKILQTKAEGDAYFRRNNK